MVWENGKSDILLLTQRKKIQSYRRMYREGKTVLNNSCGNLHSAFSLILIWSIFHTKQQQQKIH